MSAAARSAIVAFVVGTASIVAVPHTHAATVTYDLATDWSDAVNPNGAWSYNGGTNPLPHVNNYLSGLLGGGQGAWAQTADVAVGALPSWFKTVSQDIAGQIDNEVGDIVHGPAGGGLTSAGYSPGNVTWTSPINGVIDISGFLWDAHQDPGSDFDTDWALSINGSDILSGTLIGDNASGPNPRATPFYLVGAVLDNIAVGIGDVVGFRFEAVSSPQWVGLSLTIEATERDGVPMPEPATLALIGAGLLGLGLRRRKA